VSELVDPPENITPYFEAVAALHSSVVFPEVPFNTHRNVIPSRISPALTVMDSPSITTRVPVIVWIDSVEDPEKEIGKRATASRMAKAENSFFMFFPSVSLFLDSVLFHLFPLGCLVAEVDLNE